MVIECSDRDVLSEVRSSLFKAGVGAEGEIAFVDLPSAGENFPEIFVAASSVTDVRRHPTHAAELMTQIVYGDAVIPLKREGEWIMVRLDDAYVGWVRSWHLRGLSRSEYESYDRAARHRVRGNVIQVYEGPGEAALPVSDAVVGTPVLVVACDRRGWRRVTLPDGRTGFTKARGLEKRPGPATRPRDRRAPGRSRTPAGALRESLATTALRFVGVPYVWGGTTPKGFDCSGLTQRLFRLHGIVIPRDSDMQARFGRAKMPGNVPELQTGELLFFGKSPSQITHVAMYLSDGLFVHAHGQVRVSALFPAHPLFEEKFAGDWQLVRDPLLV